MIATPVPALASIQRPVTPRSLVLRYAAQCWREATALIVLTLCASVVAMVGPALVAATLAALRIGVDTAAVNASTSFDLNSLGARVLSLWPLRLYTNPVTLVVLLGIAYLAQAVVSAALQYAGGLLSVRIRTETLRLMQNNLMQHLLDLSLPFFNAAKSAELVSRLMVDAQSASNAAGPAVQGMLLYSVQVVGYGLYLFSTSGWLTAGALVILGLHFGLNRVLRAPIRRLGREVQNAQAETSSAFHELLSSVRVIKSFGAERLAIDRSRDETNKFSRSRSSQGRVESVIEPVRAVLDALAIVSVLMIAALEVARGELAPQGLVLYVFVARLMIQPANLLATSYLRVVGASVSLTRVAELFNHRPQVVDGDLAKSTFERALELRNVSFAYNRTPVLKDVSLVINRGEVIAVVGRSGAGKSTLIDLVLRLYDPTEGTVSIDGVDLRRLKQTEYRHLFGVVSQETLLFHDTVRNNIRFGRAEITDALVTEAARLAHAHHFIERLPKGFDTIVGERGTRLSGGERQRVAIARALAHRPPILVLDEATSSLDSESEHEVQLAVDHILETSTAIIIAHRLSTVLHADRIVFLDDGVITDVGPHAQLFERCAPYRRLCELQFLGGSAVEPVNKG